MKSMIAEMSRNEVSFSITIWLGSLKFIKSCSKYELQADKTICNEIKLQNNQPLLEFNHEDSEVKILLENLLLSDPNSRYFECEQTADLDPFAKVATFLDELQT